MPYVDRPSKEAIGRIAENQPGLLNLLCAYFVFEWQEVRIGSPSHGFDQAGVRAVVPDYVDMWGVDAVVHYLLQCPSKRDSSGPGFVSEWLADISG